MQNNEKIPNLPSEFKLDKRFDPFLAKKLSEIGKIPDLAHFDSFMAKKDSNLIRFGFSEQIWNPLIVLHILGTHLI